MDRVLLANYNPIASSVASKQEPFGTFQSVDGNSGNGSATAGDDNAVWIIVAVVIFLGWLAKS